MSDLDTIPGLAVRVRADARLLDAGLGAEVPLRDKTVG